LKIAPRAVAPRTSHFGLPRRGFTLLEILLAVAIFAIVLLAIHVVFFGAIRLRNKTAAALDNAVPLQHALTVMRRDLANILPPGGTLSGQFQSTPTTTATNLTTDTLLSLSGRRVSPDFYTASALVDNRSPWSEVQKVAYLLVPSTNGGAGFELVRSVSRNLLPAFDEEPEMQPLLEGVEEVYFEYYDGSTWRTEWDSTVELTPLPLAIKVQIEMLPEETASVRPAPVELLVPLVVQARTNVTDSAESSGGGQ
jgi:general secretion pathway protein J